MTHVLQELLKIGDDRPLFRVGITQLEKTAGNSGIDTRLIADIIGKTKAVIRRLGLSVRDTTGKELYYSLVSAVWSGDIEDLLDDTDYVLVKMDDGIISLNMIDVIENAHHELPYGNQTTSHGRRSLRGEIVGRYLAHARTDEKTTKETALLMGILPESDEWYNKCNYKHNRKRLTVSGEEK